MQIKLTDSTPVSRALADLKIPHRLFRHPGPISSLEQAARQHHLQEPVLHRRIPFRHLRSQIGPEIAVLDSAGPMALIWLDKQRSLRVGAIRDE